MVLEPKNWSLFFFFFLPQITFLFGGQFILSSEMDLHAGKNGFACQRKWICTLAAQKRPADCYFRSPPFFWRRHSGVKEKSVNSEQGLRCRFAPFELQILQMLNWTNCQRAPIAKKLQLPKSSNCRVTHLMLGAIAPRRDRVVRLQIDRLFWTHNDK